MNYDFLKWFVALIKKDMEEFETDEKSQKNLLTIIKEKYQIKG